MSELLVFDGEELSGAITHQDLSALRAVTWRGENVLLPGVPGTEVNPLRPDQLDQPFVFSVRGRVSWEGEPLSDPVAGVAANLEHYRSLFNSGGLHSLAYHHAGDVFEAQGQVKDYLPARTGPQTAVITVRLIVPPGGFVLADES